MHATRGIHWEVQASTGGLTNQYKVGRVTGLDYTSTGMPGVRVMVDGYVV